MIKFEHENFKIELDINVGDTVECIISNSHWIKQYEKLKVTYIDDRSIKVEGYDIAFNKAMFIKA